MKILPVAGLLPPFFFWGGGNSDAASGKISRIMKCFHISKQDLKKYFLNNKDAKKFKPPLGLIKKVQIIWI